MRRSDWHRRLPGARLRPPLLLGRRGGGSFEVRSPTSEGRKKAEFRNPKPEGRGRFGLRPSGFGLLSAFDLRPSDLTRLRSSDFRAAEHDLPSTGRTLEQPCVPTPVHGENGCIVNDAAPNQAHRRSLAAAGNRTVKTLPWPRALVAAMVPPWAWTMAWVMVSPRPTRPAAGERALSAR